MPEHHPAPVSRRAVVVGAGAAAVGAGLLVAGCSTAGAGGASGGAAAPGTALGPAAEVPLGSAKIYGDQRVVVTQAAPGRYAAFSAVCTHQGCTVAKVDGRNIICPCHGSVYTLDGSVVKGPATRPLDPRGVTVTGDQLTLS